jgi:hypothetical protein
VVVALSLGAKATRPPDVLEETATLGAKDRAKGIALIERYLGERHDPAERAWAMLWAGEQRRLAGNDTDPAVSEQLRAAIHSRSPVLADILNYRADGTAFRNGVMITPIYDADGALAWFLGSQVEPNRAELLLKSGNEIAGRTPVLNGHSSASALARCHSASCSRAAQSRAYMPSSRSLSAATNAESTAVSSANSVT